MIELSMVQMIGAIVITFAAGVAIAYLLHNAYLKKQNQTAKDLLDRAQDQVEKQKKEQLIKFREEMQNKRNKFNEEFKSKENHVGI